MSDVILPLDGSDLARKAIPLAVCIAKAAGGRLKLVEAIDPAPVGDEAPAPLLIDEIEAGVRDALEQEARAIRSTYTIEVAAEVRFHTPPGLILDAASHGDVSSIVMTTHGRTGLRRAVLGSIAESVLRQARVPVFLIPAAVPASDQPMLKHILVPVDGSELSNSVLEPVAALARLHDAMLTLLRVYPQPQGAITIANDPTPFPGSEAVGSEGDLMPPNRRVMETLDEQLGEIREEAEGFLRRLTVRLQADGLSADSTYAVGAPDELIVREAERLKVDLIAMATHGRSGLDRLRHGSVAEAVLRHSHVPLMTFGREALTHLTVAAASAK